MLGVHYHLLEYRIANRIKDPTMNIFLNKLFGANKPSQEQIPEHEKHTKHKCLGF